MAVTTPAAKSGTTDVDPLDAFLTTPIETDEQFWASTPLLQQLHDAAVDHMRPTWGTLMSLMARATMCIPVDVFVSTKAAGDAPLNLYVAAVGASGSGKSQAMSAAAEILPDIPEHTTIIPAVTSGEGLTARIASAAYDIDDNGRPDRKGGTHTELHSIGVLAMIDEISRFAAQAGREGSTSIGTMLTGWAGGALGDSNRDPAKRTAIPARCYRMSAVFGVQPAAARILIDGGATGFTQRFLWTSMGIEQRPVHDFAHRVDWPLCEISIPDRAWSNWCDTYRTGDTTGVNPRRIRLTPAMEQAVEDAQWELQREGSTVDPLDAHVVQLTERVAAILSIIEAGGLGECVVTQGAWDRAAYIIRHSREARTACFNAYAKACSEAEARRLAIQGVASDAARAHVIDQRVIRCKRCIIKKLWFTAIASGRDLEPDNIERAGLMADTVGVMGNRLRHGLARDLRDEVWQKAMDDLTDDGVVIPVGTARPGDPYTSIAWTVDTARVPDDMLPAGAKR